MNQNRLANRLAANVRRVLYVHLGKVKDINFRKTILEMICGMVEDYVQNMWAVSKTDKPFVTIFRKGNRGGLCDRRVYGREELSELKNRWRGGDLCGKDIRSICGFVFSGQHQLLDMAIGYL